MFFWISKRSGWIPRGAFMGRKPLSPKRSPPPGPISPASAQPPLSSGLCSNCGLFLYLPVSHRDYSVGLLGDLRIMGNYYEGQSVVTVQASQQLDNLCGILGVQISRRLVPPNYRGLVD